MTQPEQSGMPDMQELIRQAAEVQAQIQRCLLYTSDAADE